MDLNLTNNSSTVHWGKDKCWKCKGTGEVLVSEFQVQNTASIEEAHKSKECGKCGGTGMVPKR